MAIQVFDGDGLDPDPRKPDVFGTKGVQAAILELATWLSQMRYTLQSAVLVQTLNDDHPSMNAETLKLLEGDILGALRRNRALGSFRSSRYHLRKLINHRIQRL